MKPRFAVRSGALVALLLLTTAAGARAQCRILGPTQVCSGAPVQLCSASGGEWQWTGPGGFAASTQCVSVSAPGVYELRAFDDQNGLWFSCTTTLTAGVGPAPPVISGPATGCEGSTVALCGPTGAWSYAWSGPGGFSATGACADVSASGTYTLTITDPSTGCSGSASATVTFAPCGGGPSPGNCPRTPGWWSGQCSPSVRRRVVSEISMSEIAQCVDERAASLAFPKGVDEFCAQLAWDGDRDLAWRARRQLAAVMANLCAHEMGLTTDGGAPVGLAGDAALKFHEGPTTAAAWAAAADAELASFGTRAIRTRAQRRSLDRIVHQGWLINHGENLKTQCKPGVLARSHAVEPPLAAQSGEPEGSGATLGAPTPNPFAGTTSVRLSIADAEGADVDVAVYDLAGRRMVTLWSGRLEAGAHDARWDGRTERGDVAKAGVYFVRGHAGGEPISRSVILTR